MKWVTREKAKVDRIACPWLIKKFVDENPEFLFVPPETIQQVVKDTGAVAYDAKGVELTAYREDGEARVQRRATCKVGPWASVSGIHVADGNDLTPPNLIRRTRLSFDVF